MFGRMTSLLAAGPANFHVCGSANTRTREKGFFTLTINGQPWLTVSSVLSCQLCLPLC
jgi:hypothetical protein